MKLFKSLLVAPAALGLLAPMSVSANELNLAEVSGYSSSEEVQNISEFYPQELAVTNSRVDGLEVRINEIEAGSFSETTTASFSVDFAIGAVDGKDIQNNSSTVSYDQGTDGDEDLQAVVNKELESPLSATNTVAPSTGKV